MGSYKQGYKSANMDTVVTLLITPLITTHEPPSRATRERTAIGCCSFLPEQREAGGWQLP